MIIQTTLPPYVLEEYCILRRTMQMQHKNMNSQALHSAVSSDFLSSGPIQWEKF